MYTHPVVKAKLKENGYNLGWQEYKTRLYRLELTRSYSNVRFGNDKAVKLGYLDKHIKHNEFDVVFGQPTISYTVTEKGFQFILQDLRCRV